MEKYLSESESHYDGHQSSVSSGGLREVSHLWERPWSPWCRVEGAECRGDKGGPLAKQGVNVKHAVEAHADQDMPQAVCCSRLSFGPAS
eukprot:4684355-Amphidinium_carterae.1